MTIQFCSGPYLINMHGIREFYETKITVTSTRDENVIGPLRDTADSILEQLQNEESSLAQHIRALAILIWLVENLEKIGISLDRQTQDEVEGCEKALTGEYLRRGSYNVGQVMWVLEWASMTTIEEMVCQVPDSLFGSNGDLACLEHLAPRARLERLTRLEHLARLSHVAGLPGLAYLAGLPGLPGITGIPGIKRLNSHSTKVFIELEHHHTTTPTYPFSSV